MAKGYSAPKGRRIGATPAGLRTRSSSMAEDLALVPMYTQTERAERQATARLVHRHARDAADEQQLLDALGLADG